MIEGTIQAVRYGSSKERLAVHLRLNGEDVTSPTGTPTITIYDTDAETELVAATSLTQVGTTAVFYYDIDVSDTEVYEKDQDYLATVSFVVSGYTYEHNFNFDVVRWPYVQPLWTTDEIDTEYPNWKGNKPSDWSDWTVAIEIAHRELRNALRKMRTGNGSPVYPHIILDREMLRHIEEKFICAAIARKIRMSDKARDDILKEARDAIGNLTLFYQDIDQDMVKDDGEEVATGTQHVR